MRTKILLLLFILLGIGNVISAQQEVIPLWQGIAPGSETWTQKEVQYLNGQGQQMIRNVVTPTLTVYKPDPAKASGSAMIVAPGGGFLFLSWQTEGTEVAGDDKLTEKGSIQMYSAWKAAGVEAELHIYSKGGHGFGMQKKDLPVDSWIERLGDWMKSQGFPGQH